MIIQECIVELESALNAKRDKQIQSQSHMSPSTSSSSSEEVLSFVKLSKLELQKFSGNLVVWPHFGNRLTQQFIRTVVCQMSDKFNYLKSLLVGPTQTIEATYVYAILLRSELKLSMKGRCMSEHMLFLLSVGPLFNLLLQSFRMSMITCGSSHSWHG